jgi:hypothetical protein
MWGPTIVGFGSYHYKYASGHEGDSAITGFAARGRDMVVYIAPDFQERDVLLARLGEHKTGKVCVYIRRLANVDLKVLETLISRSAADTKSRYPERSSQLSIQSTAERKSADVELRTLVAKHASAHQQLVAAVRRSLRKRMPTAHEVAYEYRSWVVISYSPSEHGYEGVLAVRASADGVKLYFNSGKGLPDPEKLLRGSGNQVRWIQIETASTLARPAVARLIDEAIARNRVPFARTGRGRVVVRSASSRQRRGR